MPIREIAITDEALSVITLSTQSPHGEIKRVRPPLKPLLDFLSKGPLMKVNLKKLLIA